jgi:hypothetical protein
MTYKILGCSTDLADKYRVQVELDNGETLILKFDHWPDESEVQTAALNHIEALANQAADELADAGETTNA